jgi:hypothetical protein
MKVNSTTKFHGQRLNNTLAAIKESLQQGIPVKGNVEDAQRLLVAEEEDKSK